MGLGRSAVRGFERTALSDSLKTEVPTLFFDALLSVPMRRVLSITYMY